jgi:hypothetical protein
VVNGVDTGGCGIDSHGTAQLVLQHNVIHSDTKELDHEDLQSERCVPRQLALHSEVFVLSPRHGVTNAVVSTASQQEGFAAVRIELNWRRSVVDLNVSRRLAYRSGSATSTGLLLLLWDLGGRIGRCNRRRADRRRDRCRSQCCCNVSEFDVHGLLLRGIFGGTYRMANDKVEVTPASTPFRPRPAGIEGPPADR